MFPSKTNRKGTFWIPLIKMTEPPATTQLLQACKMRISGQPMQSSHLTRYFTLKEITEKCDNHECSKLHKPHDHSQSTVLLQMLTNRNGIILSVGACSDTNHHCPLCTKFKMAERLCNSIGEYYVT